MLQRKYLFPHVIEMNYQAGRRLGVNVYLIDGGSAWAIIDVGYEDTVAEVVDLIRGMDFNLSQCRAIIATTSSAFSRKSWNARMRRTSISSTRRSSVRQ